MMRACEVEPAAFKGEEEVGKVKNPKGVKARGGGVRRKAER